MVSTALSDSSVIAADEGVSRDASDVAGEDVRSEPSVDAAPTELRVERLRRVALEARVAALEAELERARRRKADVIARYEEVLAGRDDIEAPTFSWTG